MSDCVADHVTISVIVPSWRDAENLALLLPVLTSSPQGLEVVVVEASGDAESERIAVTAGTKFLRWPRPNRGEQMNAGAALATGEVLVFHHADTEITGAHIEAIVREMNDPATAGGAFYRKFDGRHPRLLWLEQVARFLTRHGGTLFGDQTVFARREVFEHLGGYATIPLMEDVDFSRRLRASGKIAVLDPPVRTSERRHISKGAWRTTMQNGLFMLLYKIGFSPRILHRWYYADCESATQSRVLGELAPELESLQP